MAVRERDRGTATRERGPGRDDRQLPHPERVERRLDEEAEPVGHDLDRDAGRLRAPDERHEPGIVRLRGGGREQASRPVRVDQRHLELHQPREPIRPAS